MSTKSLQLSEDFTKRYSTNKNLLNIDIQNKEDLLNDCKNYLYAIMIDMYYSTNICERVRNIRMYARMLSSCEEDLMKLYLIQEYFN